MTEDSEAEDQAPPVPWDRKELLALTVLLVAGVLAVGGLAAGIAAASTSSPAPLAQYVNGQAIKTGAGWAEPLIALFLLGALMLSLAALEECGEVTAEQADGGDAVSARYWRARRSAISANVLLGVTVLGAASGLAGVALVQASLPATADTGSIWSQEFLAIAGLLGTVIVMATALVTSFRRLGDR